MNDRDDSLGDSEDFRGEALRGLVIVIGILIAALALTAPIAAVAFWGAFFDKP